MKNKQQNYDLLKGRFNGKILSFSSSSPVVAKVPTRGYASRVAQKVYKVYSVVRKKGNKDNGDKEIPQMGNEIKGRK